MGIPIPNFFSQNGENFAKKNPNTKAKHEDVVCKPCVID